jgi:cell division protein FtsN
LPAPAPAKSDSAPTRATPTVAHGTWTIQLAAYNTRPDAERLVAKLADRGVKARISGAAKPFRVRLDYYKTRQEAAAAVADLKERGIIGFVTEETRPGAGSSP